MMNEDKKNKTQLIRTEIGKINDDKKKFAYRSDKYFDFIDNNIKYIKLLLKDIVNIKMHGNYRLLKNDIRPKYIEGKKVLTIDLLGIKFLGKDDYYKYQSQINENHKDDDCEICKIKNKIFSILYKKYSIINNTKIFHKQKNYYENNKSFYFSYSDSICIQFNIEDKLDFDYIRIVIRPAISCKDFPLIICNEDKIKRSFSREYINTYKSLNKITNGFLKHLFLKIDSFDFEKKLFNKKTLIKFQLLQSCNKKQILLIKYSFLSLMIKRILTSDSLKEWISKNYNNYLTDKSKIADIFKNKNFRYKRVPLFEKIYNNFKLKYLDFVGESLWPTFNELIYEFVNHINYVFENNIFNYDRVNAHFITETQILVRFDYISETYTIKGDKKLFSDINIPIKTNTVYGNDDTEANIILFNLLYNIDYIDISKYIFRKNRISDK